MSLDIGECSYYTYAIGESKLGSKSSRQERQSEILDILAEQGSVDVANLAERFEVSEMTIRNDLNFLGRQGKLLRKHGGANINRPRHGERPLTEKQKQNFQQKYAICRKAATLLSSGMSVILDAGTTTEHIVGFLDEITQLTVITNGVNLLSSLIRHPAIQVYTVGGRVDANSHSILGEDAESGLRKYNAQIGFITADGVSLDHGVTNNSQEATSMSRILIGNSMRKVLLADSSKVGKIGAFPLCPWEQIDIWVTDNGVDAAFKSAVESMGVEVLTGVV